MSYLLIMMTRCVNGGPFRCEIPRLDEVGGMEPPTVCAPIERESPLFQPPALRLIATGNEGRLTSR